MTSAVVQMFVNPRTRWFERKRIAALKPAFERAGASVIVTPSASNALLIDPRTTHVCSVGGDGTLRHVVDALHRCGRKIPLSVYPNGTVNLVARELGYPRDQRAFVARALGDHQRTIHYTAHVNGTPMLACASVGPDSLAVAALSPISKRMVGRSAYVVSFAKLLISWKRMKLIVSAGDQRFACEAIYVAKARYFAGPWSFAPAASGGEPLLYVVALERASRAGFLRLCWALLRRQAMDELSGVRCLICTELTISGDADVPLQADGDVLANLPVTISVDQDPIEFA